MGQRTEIEWCDHTFNAWEGCQKVSPACKHCYAELRDEWIHSGAHWGPDSPRLLHSEAYWDKPLRWDSAAEKSGRRATVFANSLGDVFEDHPGVIDARYRLFELIYETPHLFWLLLTKRPENIIVLCPQSWCYHPPPNVGLGVTVESQEYADKRIQALLRVRAALYFVSIEPILGAVELPPEFCALRERAWTIVGTESGHYRRPAKVEWIRSLRDQCQLSAISFFLKQMEMDGHLVKMPKLDGQRWQEVPHILLEGGLGQHEEEVKP